MRRTRLGVRLITFELRTIIIGYKAIVSRLAGSFAEGHVFDLGSMHLWAAHRVLHEVRQFRERGTLSKLKR